MSNAFLCAKCPSVAAHTVELTVFGQRKEQELCDIHLLELLDGARRSDVNWPRS
jgi:hypothetical protein